LKFGHKDTKTLSILFKLKIATNSRIFKQSIREFMAKKKNFAS